MDRDHEQGAELEIAIIAECQLGARCALGYGGSGRLLVAAAVIETVVSVDEKELELWERE